MRLLLIPVIAFSLFLGGCKKNEDSGVAGWSTTTYGPELSGLYNPIAPAEQRFTINLGRYDTVTTTEGIRFVFPDDAFLTAGGGLAFGTATVRIHEYFNNAQLLSGGIGTATTDGRLLATGGAFNISVKGEDETGLLPAKLIDVSIPTRGGYNTSHRIFIQKIQQNLVPAAIADPNLVNWGLDSTTWKQGQHGANSFYDFSLYQLGWWNLDRFMDLGNGMTACKVVLPAGFGNTNTTVVLLTPENGLVRLYGDPSIHQFTSGGYKVPVGLQMKVLAIARQGGQYSYSIKDITISDGQSVTIDAMQTISEQALQQVIRSSLN